MKIQITMTQPKETTKISVTDSKEMDICNLPEEKFK